MERIEISFATGQSRTVSAQAYIVNDVWTLIDDGDPVPPGAVLASTLPVSEVVEQPPQLTPVQITKVADFFKSNPDIAAAFGL